MTNENGRTGAASQSDSAWNELVDMVRRHESTNKDDPNVLSRCLARINDPQLRIVAAMTVELRYRMIPKDYSNGDLAVGNVFSAITQFAGVAAAGR